MQSHDLLQQSKYTLVTANLRQSRAKPRSVTLT
jgi:hypothetical protein